MGRSEKILQSPRQEDNLSLWNILSGQAKQRPDAPAIIAPGKKVLTYGQFLSLMENIHAVLRAAGLGSRDRVAVVLPNGPEMAVALPGVMASLACAPLNPSYSAKEFEFYLSDLKANALLTQASMNSEAVQVAQALGIPVCVLAPGGGEEAGFFTLSSVPSQDPDQSGYCRPENLALLLHTSGTTARPKLVPLTHANICSSARNITSALELNAADRYLNIMPLFHVHGLIGGLLSSLFAGSCVMCTPGFQILDFFHWLADFRPTWFTAVPTMHQSILAQAQKNKESIRRCSLRFIRSCSAPLPVAVLDELEKVFQTPVVEAYGMTEAAHQMACNSLPPRPRKPGSVGIPTGIEIAVLDEAGRALPYGGTGEVAIRGRSVMAGYENNSEANEKSFTYGWFRTGDQGHFDEDGYLFLTGRLKEMINRGGEKISPREIDEVLVTHPAVSQAVTFAIPDDRLGEDVAAAVVRRSGAKVSEEEIRLFVSQKLAYFKVPRLVVFLDEIPKGPTGKVQRMGLAKTLGLESKRKQTAEVSSTGGKPRTDLDRQLLDLFGEVLGGVNLGIEDNFFQAGGDSILAVQVLARLEKLCGIHIPVAAFVLKPNVKNLADRIEGKKPMGLSSLVPIKAGGSLPPLFLAHPHDGRIFQYYKLAEYLDSDLPVYAFQALERGHLMPESSKVERMARAYVQEMLAFYPEGPYFLGGYCFGTWIALEMARDLWRQNRRVGFLALTDGYIPGFPKPQPGLHPFQHHIYLLLDRMRRIRPFLHYYSHRPMKQGIRYLKNSVRRLLRESVVSL